MPRLIAPNVVGSTHTLTLTISGSAGAYSFAYNQTHTRVVDGNDSLTISLSNATTDRPQAAIYLQNFASTSVSAMGPPPTFGPGVTSVTFSLDLPPNLLVDFAMFVAVTPAGGPTTILYCDPQIGNDPD
jgi:hypothetical protein